MKIKKVMCYSRAHDYPAWILCLSDNYGAVGVDHFWLRTNGSYAAPPTAKSIRNAVYGYSLKPLPECVIPYADKIEQVAPVMATDEVIDLDSL